MFPRWAILSNRTVPNGGEVMRRYLFPNQTKEAKVQEITVQCEKEEFIELLENLDQNDTNFDYNTGKSFHSLQL